MNASAAIGCLSDRRFRLSSQLPVAPAMDPVVESKLPIAARSAARDMMKDVA
jgi:hypothetical protein